MVSLSHDILEHEASVQALVFIGATAVKDWGRKGPEISPTEIIYPTEQTGDPEYTYKRPENEEMGKWVAFFLRAIRETFPTVEVGDLSSDSDSGQFERGNWVPGAKRCALARKTPSNENIMLHWEAEYAGRMWLDYDVSSLICETILRHPCADRARNSSGLQRWRPFTFGAQTATRTTDGLTLRITESTSSRVP
jgi:hypothetical protein